MLGTFERLHVDEYAQHYLHCLFHLTVVLSLFILLLKQYSRYLFVLVNIATQEVQNITDRKQP